MGISCTNSKPESNIAGVCVLTDIVFAKVPCIENSTRLNGDVVQICHTQEWGLVCSNGWDENAANVMCNHVGLPSQSE